jgi:hypothetical protein
VRFRLPPSLVLLPNVHSCFCFRAFVIETSRPLNSLGLVALNAPFHATISTSNAWTQNRKVLLREWVILRGSSWNTQQEASPSETSLGNRRNRFSTKHP